MKVLYVVGACLRKNTSANMSHNAYVQGLVENGCDVEILMADDSWGVHDEHLPTWENIKYYSYPSVSKVDSLRRRASSVMSSNSDTTNVEQDGKCKLNDTHSLALKQRVRRFAKSVFYRIFPADPLFPLEKTWLKKATRFRSEVCYDIVVSNSSPAASHKLVKILLERKQIVCKRWIQIWEDPWYADLYSDKRRTIFDEEYSMLRKADEIYYVSPLTLKYQKELFPDCASKMKHIPLPYLNFSKSEQMPIDECSFGYFGDYFSKTRNLLPFYEALSETEHPGYIYGDTDLNLKSTEHIQVSGRVTLDVLDEVQAKTCVLVHLCNLRGGQIPGKIYHYSATNKPILFILDGTEEEQDILYDYFSQFNRYYFCKNSRDAILSAMSSICEDNRTWDALVDFAPKNIIKKLL